MCSTKNRLYVAALDTMPNTRATPAAPSHPPASASVPCDAHATPTALADDDQPKDVDILVIQIATPNAINIQHIILSTAPRSFNISHDERLRNPQDIAATHRFIIILDEKFHEKTRNPHHKGFIFCQIIPDLVAQVRYKTFLTKQPLIERELVLGVRVTTHFASYQDWRAALLANIYDGSAYDNLYLTTQKKPGH
jgi:hypothetical protein